MNKIQAILALKMNIDLSYEVFSEKLASNPVVLKMIHSSNKYHAVARNSENTVMCQTASSLVRYQHWAWRGRYRKHSLIYRCVLDRVYRAFAWQRFVQIRYNTVACSTVAMQRSREGTSFAW
jgi:hypothetical protein